MYYLLGCITPKYVSGVLFPYFLCKSAHSVCNLQKPYLSCRHHIKTAVLKHITSLDWTNCSEINEKKGKVGFSDSCVQVRYCGTVIPFSTFYKCSQTFVQLFLGNKEGLLVRYVKNLLACAGFWPQDTGKFWTTLSWKKCVLWYRKYCMCQ